jgi:hypothetical protein
MTTGYPPGVQKLFQSNWLLAALLLLCFGRLWLMGLPSSFWVDEMGTVFVVQHGADHPSFAVAPQVPDSIYYWLPKAAARLFGASEIAYRIPSILAAALALFFISRIAARLIHPRAAWFAAFACLGLRDFNEHAADARPYALGMCVGAACVWFLVRWLDSGRIKDAVLFVLPAALLWRVHLIYWPFYIVLALYAAVRVERRETPVRWWGALGAFAAVGVLLIPVALRALALMRHAQAHVILALPSMHHFEWTLRWKLPLLAGGIAWLLGRALAWKPDGKPLSKSALVLVFGWWLILPFCLLFFSYATGASVYVERYFSLSLPGLALAATFAVRPFFGAVNWKPMTALLGIGAIALLGQWHYLWLPHQHSEWRGAAALVNRIAPDSAVPVICTSPFVEAQSPNWRPDYPLPGFLYAQLPVYPVHGQILLFPFETSPDAEQYAGRLVGDGTLTRAGRFAIYGSAGNVRFWRKWLGKRQELAAWTSHLTVFGDVYVVEFRRA